MGYSLLTQFAEAAPAPEGSLFGALGIDWQMLLFQITGFLVLVWLMGRYIYPVLMKQVDKHQEQLEESTKAAMAAEKNAAATEEKITKLLSEARSQAKEIVATAKEEAKAMVADSDEKATENAKRITDQARESIEKDVIAAKKALHNETIELVAMATEKVIEQKVNTKTDAGIIREALGRAK